ncbi:transcriptional regulator, partial [Bacillus safensis]|nr:transcriptional regulator [Bacillus safensis]
MKEELNTNQEQERMELDEESLFL